MYLTLGTVPSSIVSNRAGRALQPQQPRIQLSQSSVPMAYVNEVYLVDPASSFKPADRCFKPGNCDSLKTLSKENGYWSNVSPQNPGML